MRGILLSRPLVLCLLALTLSGCIERKIIIRADPPSARISLDGEELPVVEGEASKVFFFHGSRRVVVRKRGYQTHSQLFLVSAPWYSVFPMDLICEFLIPWTIEDHRALKVTLKATEPLTAKQTDALLERATTRAEEEGSELGR